MAAERVVVASEAPAKVRPAPAEPEMIPLKVRVTADALFVITRVLLPSPTVPENVAAPLPAKAKSPLTVILFAKALVPVELIVPPLIVSGEAEPPKPLLPETITVPASSVKLLPTAVLP